jgi:xeroderma pigmentosum group C-complementing protein
LKRSAKLQKVQVPEDDECGGGNYEGIIKLYGKWQLEPLHLPHAVIGIVPKVNCYFLSHGVCSY